ncbi:RICTOR V domain containing protein [Trichuris trichiura]|uniref:RICTOR V domain containing protein n=1 Tax=Trichuris trichiura TaxID=36087 RepID=A0A077ZGF8_TRITR|nr:RICTOR V domain containing protein [Trichuris trichiura]
MFVPLFVFLQFAKPLQETRLYATHYVIMLGQMRVDHFAEWGINVLTDQLNDSSAEVVEAVIEGQWWTLLFYSLSSKCVGGFARNKFFFQGQIGCRDAGMMLLPLCVVPAIVRVAEQCNMCHIRGCAYYAISLISKNCFGSEILSLLGWDKTAVKVPLSLSEFKKSRHDFLMKMKEQLQYWQCLIIQSTSMKQSLFPCTEMLSGCSSTLPLHCTWCSVRNKILHVFADEKELISLLTEEYSIPVVSTEIPLPCCMDSLLTSAVPSDPFDRSDGRAESVDSMALLFQKTLLEPKRPLKSPLQSSSRRQMYLKSNLGQVRSLPVYEISPKFDTSHGTYGERLSFSLDDIRLIRDTYLLKKSQRLAFALSNCGVI